MRKMLTASLLVVAILFVVSGCEKSPEVNKADLYASIFDVPVSNFKPDSRLLVRNIVNFDSYVFNDLSDLGITCPSGSVEANQVLNQIASEAILEKYISDIAGYRVATYIVPNKDGMDTQEFKSAFEQCSGGVMPLQARKGKLVFGSMGCVTEDELLMKKCQAVMGRVERYFNI